MHIILGYEMDTGSYPDALENDEARQGVVVLGPAGLVGVLETRLSIRTPDELKGHPLFGSIFETFIVGELYKRVYHLGEKPPFYFWRDKTGNEIDLLVDIGPELLPVEIKSSKTYSREFKSSVLSWFNLKGNTSKKGFVIYRGKDVVGKKSTVTAVPWWYL